MGEGFAGTNVIAIRLESLGEPEENNRRKRETNDTSASDTSNTSGNSTQESTEAPTTTNPPTTTTMAVNHYDVEVSTVKRVKSTGYDRKSQQLRDLSK